MGRGEPLFHLRACLRQFFVEKIRLLWVLRALCGLGSRAPTRSSPPYLQRSPVRACGARASQLVSPAGGLRACS
jgi:hypothetical protein